MAWPWMITTEHSSLEELRDLTDILTRDESQLFQAWGAFSAFLRDGLVVAFIKDRDGRMLWYNEPYRRVFQLSGQDQIGKTDAEIWPEATAKELRAHDLHIFASGEPEVVKESVPTPEAAQDWLVFKAAFDHPPQGRLLGGFAIRLPSTFHL